VTQLHKRKSLPIKFGELAVGSRLGGEDLLPLSCAVMSKVPCMGVLGSGQVRSTATANDANSRHKLKIS
jgi:hypothetical protein